MAYIYKICNTINSKLYIGKTEATIETRFAEHCRDCKKDHVKNRPLYYAMRKYGIDKFYAVCLEETTTELAAEREQYWIAYYHTYINDPECCGYNATLGGDGSPFIDRELVINTYKSGMNEAQTAQICNTTPDTVCKILRANKIYIKSSQELNKEILGKPVKMCTKDSIELMTFSSCADAARYLIENKFTRCKFTTIRGHISEVARGKRLSAAGYVWKFIN